MLHKHKAKISFTIGIVIGIMFILSLSLSRTNIEYNITGINNIKDELVLSIDNTNSIEKAQKEIGVTVDGVTFNSEVVDNHLVFDSSLITDEFYVTINRDIISFEDNITLILNSKIFEYDILRSKFKPTTTVGYTNDNKMISQTGNHNVRVSNYYTDESYSYVTFEYSTEKNVNLFINVIDSKGTQLPYSLYDLKKQSEVVQVTYKVESIDALQTLIKIGTSIEDVKNQEALRLNLQ